MNDVFKLVSKLANQQCICRIFIVSSCTGEALQISHSYRNISNCRIFTGKYFKLIFNLKMICSSKEIEL